MAIEPIHTLEELAEMTGRPASFWAAECDSGRLGCIRPGSDRSSVLVQESDYEAWVARLRVGGERPESEEPDDDEVPSEAYLSKAEQEALLAVL